MAAFYEERTCGALNDLAKFGQGRKAVFAKTRRFR
jgi:hypothetical protein